MGGQIKNFQDSFTNRIKASYLEGDFYLSLHFVREAN